MDESESLDALANVLNNVAAKPYDVTAHVQHIQLARSLEGMQAEVLSALEMMTQVMAAGDDVWLPLIEAKENAVDTETEEGVKDLLTFYDRAESDYLCKSSGVFVYLMIDLKNKKAIPILQKHLNFLLEHHALYLSGEQLKPDSLGTVFSTSWTRQAISEVVAKGEIHLAEVCIDWICGFMYSVNDLIRARNSGIYNETGNWKCWKQHLPLTGMALNSLFRIWLD